MTHALPNPANRFERYHVAHGGKHYIAEFFSGQAREVQVEDRRIRRGYRKPRTLWYGLSNGAPVAPTGRAAEVLSYIQNPAEAERCGAVVEDQETRSARLDAEAAERKARFAKWAAANEAAARVAEAAPDMRAALQALVAEIESNGDTALYSAQYRAAKAALALAAGVNPAAVAA